MKCLRKVFICLLAIWAVQPVRVLGESQLYRQWKSDPANAILPDFSHAGFGDGRMKIPQISESDMPVFDIAEFGGVPDDDEDDQAAMQQAIDAAAAAGGGIVKLHAGTYLLSPRSIYIRHSGIIVRGAGKNQTLLKSTDYFHGQIAPFTGYALFFVGAPNWKAYELVYGYNAAVSPVINNWDGVEGAEMSERIAYRHDRVPDKDVLAQITSDIPRHGREATVSSTKNLFEGQAVLLAMRDPRAASEVTAPFDRTYWEYLRFDQQQGYDAPDGHNYIRQLATIESISGSTVRFMEPVHMAYKTEYDPVIAFFPHIENVGFEDLGFEGVIVKSIQSNPDGGGYYSPGIAPLAFGGVRNGWVKNVRFFNTGNAVTVTQGLHVTVENCEFDFEAGIYDDGVDRFNPPHNSFKFLSHSSHNLMENLTVAKRVDHGYAVQRHATGNVFYNCSLAPTTDLDPHAQVPMVNLYDNIKGGRHSGAGGNSGTTPHHGPYLTIWNMAASGDVNTHDGYHSLNVIQWYEDQAWPLQTIRPIFVGYHHQSKPVKVQYVPDDKLDYYVSDTVVVEGINRTVEPQSLYMAQLQHRIGGNREPGFIALIDGPRNLFTGKSYTFSARTAGASASQYEWLIDSTEQKSGNSINLTFDQPGSHTILLTAKTASGISMHRMEKVQVVQKDGMVIEPATADGMERFATRLLGVNGRKWKFVEGVANGNTYSYLKGSTFGFGSVSTNDEGPHGGYCYTELPEEGMSLSGLQFNLDLYAYQVKKNPILRFLARDTNGFWAMSTKQLDTAYTLGSFDDLQWEAPVDTFNLQSGSFNPEAVNALGFVLYYPNRWWYGTNHPLAVMRHFEVGKEVTSTSGRLNNSVADITPLVRGHAGMLHVIVPEGRHRVAITTVSGRRVSEFSGANAQSYTLKNLTSGVYLVQVEMAGRVVNNRIFIAR